MKNIIIIALIIFLGVSAYLSYQFVFQEETTIKPVSITNKVESTFTEQPIQAELVSANAVPEGNLNISDAQLEQISKKYKGVNSIYIRDPLSGSEAKIYHEQKYYAASLFKIPVAVAVLREVESGNISMDDKIKYEEKDYQDGSGTLQNGQIGDEFSVKELLSLLLKESDNVAQNLLQKKLTKDKPGIAVGAVSSNDFPFKMEASTQDIVTILENLYLQKYINEQNTALLLNIMSQTVFDDRIHQGLSPSIVFSHKIGNWNELSTWHDCGIAVNPSNNKTLVVCVMTKDTSYEEFLLLTGEVGALVNEYLVN